MKFSRLNDDFICLLIEARAQEGQESVVGSRDQGPMIKGTSSRVIIQGHVIQDMIKGT
jgi:hypothetical protein